MEVLQHCSRVWDCLWMMFRSFWKKNAKKHTSGLGDWIQKLEMISLCACNSISGFGEFGGV